MSEHPPPAPGWILGEDGHWKPPPFDLGTGPTGPPPPPTSAPPPGWGPAPGWGPPPPSGSSTGRTVAIVLGALSVAGVAFLALLVGAVTLLGTTAEPEFTVVGSSIPGDDPSAGGPVVDAPDDPTFDDDPFDAPGGLPGTSPDAHPSAEALGLVADALRPDDWSLDDHQLMGPDEPVAAAPCAPEGWQTGALDRAVGTFGLPDAEADSPLTVTVVTYRGEAAAADDLERARSSAYQDCEVLQRRQLGRLAPTSRLSVLPDDPTAPGVAIAMTEDGEQARTEYDHIIVVGRMRAQLDVCHCAGFDLLYLRWVAADVAAALATVQGLPAPG